MFAKIIKFASVAVRAIVTMINTVEIVKFAKKIVKVVKEKKKRHVAPEWAKVRMDAIKALIMAIPLLIPLLEARGRDVVGVILAFLRGFIDNLGGDYGEPNYGFTR